MSSFIRTLIRTTRPTLPHHQAVWSRQSAQIRLFSTRQDTKLCPNCSQPLPTALPACTKCWSISQISSQSRHHDLFQLPYNPNPFIVDESFLKRQFRQSQAICHPDTWVSKGSDFHTKDKQDAALQLSSRINQAYQTLLNPLSRIEYILDLNGIPMSETDKVEDMEFLGDIMTAREEIQTAESRDEVAHVIQENQGEELILRFLDNIKPGTTDKIEETMEEIGQLVENKEWQKAKEAAIRLRYLDGIRRAARELE
ncbi:hypothetical protein WG66_015320 [Moniliophthora roreri]|uniref:Co-chaperone HscB C-terminal oligomerisation domain-containing protein n=1 Tax=Moniliophthora roreri TaxID=221103 RepID=A0A0W0G3G2_MONRR|nr:hypothetical protein WG66_015320 [Moniliophthora roreri]